MNIIYIILISILIISFVTGLIIMFLDARKNKKVEEVSCDNPEDVIESEISKIIVSNNTNNTIEVLDDIETLEVEPMFIEDEEII